MYLPIEKIVKEKGVFRREEQENNIIYLGKKKTIKNNEVVEIEAIMMMNTVSGDEWIWSPSHKDLIADDYVVAEKPKK
jgi:hypothetical protein